MSANSSSLKKQNQELKAQIDVLSDEINNLKMQLNVNAGDDATAAAAAQFGSDQRSSTAISSLSRLMQMWNLSD